MYGYLMEITRGARVVPELDDYGRLFFDGVKLIVVGLIYAIPLFIVYALILGATVALMGSGSDTGAVAGIGTMMIGFLVILILGVMIALFEVIGSIRLARTDSIGEVFNFSAILAHIGRIGWGPYVVALVVVIAAIVVVEVVLSIIPILGWLLLLILMPAFKIFAARYVTLLYDSVPAPA
jgi:ABC-type xylose transport system permease subunit